MIPAKRLAKGLSARARALGVAAGIVPYRPLDKTRIADWDREYEAGELERYGGLAELPRYAVIVGYIQFFGGNPSILDVGCGTGILAQRMRALDFCRYVGIDPSPRAISEADRLGDDRLTFAVADLPTPELGPFDVVVCNEVLYYVPDPAALLDRVHGALNPGGRLVTSIWRHPGDGALHAMIAARFELDSAVEVKSVASRWLRSRIACYHRDG